VSQDFRRPPTLEHAAASARRLVVAIAAGAACLAVAQAATKDEGTDPSMTVEKSNELNVINPDGTFEMFYEESLVLNEERAVKRFAQVPIHYNRVLETVEVTEAYTQKPDGRKIAVQPDQVKDQQEPQSSGAPIFQDMRVRTVIFPEVGVGDRLFLKFRKLRTMPLFPGHYEDLSLPSFFPIKQFQRIYDVPDKVQLRAEAKGFSGSSYAAGPGRKRYQWDYVPGERRRIESGAVSYFDYGDRLLVSTFGDFAEFASAYQTRAKDKAVVTPKIRELERQIAKGINEPRSRALALGEWVRKNIRYVAVYIGPGGVVPHESGAILDNRYGDCKDHVVLLEALLAAAGIDSTPALVNLGTSYRLQEVPTLGVLNHVITYVPSLDLFLDSTAEAIAPGYLPLSLLDKPVILTKTGRTIRTPAAQKDTTVSSTEFLITTSGAADFTHTSTISGWEAEWSRYLMRNIKPSDRDLAVERILQQYGQKGSGTIDVGNVEGSGDEYEMKIKGHTENLINLPGPIGIPTISSFGAGILSQVMRLASEKERTQPFLCLSGESREESIFLVPKEIAVVALPKSVAIHDAYFDYTSDYAQRDGAVVMRRYYRFHQPRMVCTPEDFNAMSSAVAQIIRDFRNQVIVQSN
jgi:transglutaminase-like putative cysteine protease